MRIDSVKAAFRFLAQRGLRRRALPKHSAREQIRSVDRGEILCRDFASYRATDEPIGLTQTSAVQGIANRTCISEMRLVPYARRCTSPEPPGQLG